MSRNDAWLSWQVSAVGCVVAASAGAEEPSFAAAGTWLAGGSTHFSVTRSTDEAEPDPYSYLNLELAPELAWFAGDRVAIQLSRRSPGARRIGGARRR